jgi:hypothetical protein
MTRAGAAGEIGAEEETSAEEEEGTLDKKGKPPSGENGETVSRLCGKVNGNSEDFLMRTISIRMYRNECQRLSGTDERKNKRRPQQAG